MLVLNTNNWWEIAIPKWVKSTFPDFGQILFVPNIMWLKWAQRVVMISSNYDASPDMGYYVPLSNNAWITADANNVIKTVWTVKINCFSQLVQPKTYYNWNSLWKWVWNNGSIQWESAGATWTKTYWFRCAYPIELEWWKIVGKRIIWDAPYTFYYNTSYTPRLDMSITISLLHSDWTVSQIWTSSFSDTDITWLSSNVYCLRHHYFDITTQWVESQDWDLVIVEYNIAAWAMSWVIFWNTGPNNLRAYQDWNYSYNYTWCLPMQISIE